MRVPCVSICVMFACLACVPSAAHAAGCSAGVPFEVKGGGKVYEAEWLEWPPGRGGKLMRREAVEGDRLASFTGYTVTPGSAAIVTAGDTTYRVSGGGYFTPQCSAGTWQLRMMRGRIEVRGEKFSGSRPRSTMNTPEAIYMPLAGTPNYTVTRHVAKPGSPKHDSYATLSVAEGGSTVWARSNGGLLFSGRSIPCSIGRKIWIYDDGKTRTG